MLRKKERAVGHVLVLACVYGVIVITDAEGKLECHKGEGIIQHQHALQTVKMSLVTTD